MDNNHWTFAREIFKGELLNNGFIDRDNFFAHNVFPFGSQKSATISLKTYGLKIMNKPRSLKTGEALTMTNENISSETEQVLIGSLLGDGGLILPKKGINAYFREMHSIKQKEYLEWKKGYLKVFNPKLKYMSTFDTRTNKYYHHAVLWTNINPLLTMYRELLYKNKRKKIGGDILNKVDLLALAIWYCDDGSFGYINQNGKIATYLSYEDNRLIAKFLKKRFDIHCTVNKDGKRYHLYFSVKEIRKFLNLIKDYVPECMNYKLGPFSEENSVRLKEENLKRRERDKIRHKRDMADPIKRNINRKWRRDYHKRKMRDPEYRKKHHKYHKIWSKNYRKNNREKYNEYYRLKQREYYSKKKK